MKYNMEELGKIAAQGSRYRQVKDWGFYLNVAKNLAKTIAGLHKINQVVGDLNDKNVLVDMNNAQVTLIDNDSFHITLNSETHRCSVGMGEYIAPEIQGINFREAPMPTFTKNTDNFSLAILIFKLLMNGLHPFNSSTIDEISIEENIKKGRSPFFINENKGKSIEPPYAPPIDIFSPKLYKLFKAAFNDSKDSPRKRPSAEDFYNELDNLSKDKNLKSCSDNKHKYPKEMNCCPWCYVNEKMDRLLKGSLPSEDLTFNSFSKMMKKSAEKKKSTAKSVSQTNSNYPDDNYGDYKQQQPQTKYSSQQGNASANNYPTNNNLSKTIHQQSYLNSIASPPTLLKEPTVQPTEISKANKTMKVLGCVAISILTVAACLAVLFMPLITSIFAVIMLILALINLPKGNSDDAYNNIVEFPSYVTVKCKSKKSIWYIVVSKYKLALFNCLSLAAMISFYISALFVIDISVLWSLVSFSLAAIFNAYYVTEKRTLWTKSPMGIILGIISILSIILSLILFVSLLISLI